MMVLLETERLLIRPFVASDESDAVALFTGKDFMAWSLDGALSPDRARKKLRDLIALYATHGFSKLALFGKCDRRLIGYCGFGLEPIDGTPMPEFGFRLQLEERGKGFVPEAGRAVLADAFERLGMTFVQALVAEANAPSRRVLDKLGMTCERSVTLCAQEFLLYRLERPS